MNSKRNIATVAFSLSKQSRMVFIYRSIVLIALFSSFAYAQTAVQDSIPGSAMRDKLASVDSVAVARFMQWNAQLDTILYRFYQSQTALNFQFSAANNKLEFNLNPQENWSRQIDHDYTGSRLKRDQIDQPSLLNLSGLALMGVNALRKKSHKQKDVQDLPIPSDLELEILKLVWEKEGANGRDIYAALDSTTFITFIQLRQKLKQLTSTGFISSKIISPQNPFMILTPVGGFSFEMSPKNRRNREYQYSPRIKKDDLFRYLSARYYLMSNAEGARAREESELLRGLLTRLISQPQ